MRPRGPSWPPRFPPHRRWEHVPPQAIQEMFRRVFVRWGLPDRVRVDNGYPWGTPRDLPSELALWLIGLGVEPIWNPPGQPTCNPKVERSNGLTQQWGELHTCTDCEQAAAGAGLGRPHPTRRVPGDPRSDPHGSVPATRHAAACVSAGPREGDVGSRPEWTPSWPGGAGGGMPMAMERSRSTGTADRSVGPGLDRRWWCGSMRPHGVGWSPIRTGNWSSSCRRAN